MLLLEYLLKNGSEEVIKEARDHIIEIQTLSEFAHIDENNKDVGINGKKKLNAHFLFNYFSLST